MLPFVVVAFGFILGGGGMGGGVFGAEATAGWTSVPILLIEFHNFVKPELAGADRAEEGVDRLPLNKDAVESSFDDRRLFTDVPFEIPETKMVLNYYEYAKM